MLKTIVLICSLSTSPAECSPANALDVTNQAPTSNPSICGLFGQAGIATTQLRPGPGQYVMIVCERHGQNE